MYEVKGKVLYDNIQFVLDMMNEIIYKTKFSDYKRLKEIIAKLKSRMESTMTSAGHSTAMLAGMAQFSRNAYYSNEMRGYGFYELIQKLDSQFDELKEDIADKLSKLVDYIFHKENIIVSFTADDKGYDAFAPAFGKYVEGLKNRTCQHAKESTHLQMSRQDILQLHRSSMLQDVVISGMGDMNTQEH